MQDEVPTNLAHTLAADFYRRLFDHGQVDLALNEARSLVYKSNQFEWAVPVLFLRLQDGRLFATQSLEPPERVRFDGLIEEYTRLFAGREAAIAELEQFMADPAGGFLLVKAGAGLGKTALMANLVARHRHTLAYHFFSPRIAESLQETVFLRNILEQMGPWYGVNVPPTGQAEAMRKRYDALLGEAPQGVRTVVLDGLDEVTGWDLSRYLARSLPPGLHFILTVRDTGQDPVQDYALPGNQVRSMSLVGLTREGVQAVLRAAGGGAIQFAEDEGLLDRLMRITVYDANRPELGADTLFVRFLAEDAAAGKLKPADFDQVAVADGGLPRPLVASHPGRVRGGGEPEEAPAIDGGPGRHPRRGVGAHRPERSGSDQPQPGERHRAGFRRDGRASCQAHRRARPARRLYAAPPAPARVSQAEAQDRPVRRQASQATARSGATTRAATRWPTTPRTWTRPPLRPTRRCATRRPKPWSRWSPTGNSRTRTWPRSRISVASRLTCSARLEAAAGDDTPEALPLLVDSALSLVRFRRERLRPEPLFDLAAQGDIPGARQMLDAVRDGQQVAADGAA